MEIILGLLIIVAFIFGTRDQMRQAEQKKQDALARAQKLKELNQKQKAYQDALSALRQDPTNASLHEQALQLGRIYSAATREGNIVTLFDETALANDIRAVTANATQTTMPVSAPSSATTPATSLDDRINALLKMKASGLITDAEFDQKRKELLDSI
jgi:type II secretory pathway pseudopilin PulG